MKLSNHIQNGLSLMNLIGFKFIDSNHMVHMVPNLIWVITAIQIVIEMLSTLTL